jgi:fatty-acid desaturase
MFSTSKFNERLFHMLTFICQGSSYLNPRAYAIMHREHHAYSDTEKDPHSPYFFRDVFQMMWRTAQSYKLYEKRLKEPEAQFKGSYPEWGMLDFLMLGELFQNNHHKRPNNSNFAAKWYEIDPVYPVMKFMHWVRIIRLRKPLAG